MSAEILNAIIERAGIGFEHGHLTVTLQLNYGSTCQCFGGINIGGPAGGPFVKRVMEVVGVKEWWQLEGKSVRAKSTATRVEAIGNIIKEDWFDPALDLPADTKFIAKELDLVKAAVHAAHGLIAPLGNQPTPSVMAIREATSILRGAL